MAGEPLDRANAAILSDALYDRLIDQEGMNWQMQGITEATSREDF